MKIIAITGGTGFIGRALAKKLLADNYQPRILTRRLPKKRLENMQYAVIDYDNPHSVEKAFENCDVVVHLAAALFCRSKEEFEKANTQNTRAIVNAVNSLEKKPAKVVYISSLAAGGPSSNADKPRTEDMKENPVSIYGKTKLAGEEEIKRLDDDIEFTILRPPIVYGKHDSGFSKIAKFVKKGFMINAGGKDAFFSFIFLEDLIEVIKTAVENHNVLGKTYYVCENSVYNWKTFIQLMSEAMRVKMPIMITMPGPLVYLMGYIYEFTSGLMGKAPLFNRDKAKESNAGNWIAYSGRWEKDTNWEGWTPLKEGLKRSFEKEEETSAEIQTPKV
ncbi:MAG: NAD-dependent epimerase/dehydratase family protein [Elusimicrobiales bacterium]|nr:NAD-dependent epimerase/dehydratase family protein [Elusimicrobiales bacterium]